MEQVARSLVMNLKKKLLLSRCLRASGVLCIGGAA